MIEPEPITENYAPRGEGETTTSLLRIKLVNRIGSVSFRKCAILNRHEFRTTILFGHEAIQRCVGANCHHCAGGFDLQKRNAFCSINPVVNSRLSILVLLRSAASAA
jgi:hypothetical protein